MIFKTKDADNLEQAFKEFTAKTLQKEQKSSIRQNLSAMKEKAAAKNAERGKLKKQGKGACPVKPDLKRLLLLNLPYLFFVYLFGKLGQAYRLAAGVGFSEKVLHCLDGFTAAFANAAPSLHPFDLCISVAGAVLMRLVVYVKGKNAKKYRKGMKYGSARWGTAADIRPYIDPDFYNNVLLTQTERLTMNGRPKQPKYARNKNVLVIAKKSLCMNASEKAALKPRRRLRFTSTLWADMCRRTSGKSFSPRRNRRRYGRKRNARTGYTRIICGARLTAS